MDIKLKQCPAYDCLDMLIVPIAKYYKSEYRLMFRDNWRFIYDQKDQQVSLHDRIKTHTRKAVYLSKYHGIEVSIIDKKNELFSIEFIKRQLELKIPIIIKMDIFHCPWIFRAYRKSHAEHYCIVTNIDNGNLYCKDSYVYNNETALPLEEFNVGCYFIAQLHYQKVETTYDCMSILKKEVRAIKKSMMIDSIRCFAMDVETLFDIKKEVQPFSKLISTAPITSKLLNVSSNRCRFALTLEYIQEVEKIDDLKYIIEGLKYISNMWKMVLGMLIKSYFIDNTQRLIVEAANKLREIADFEERLLRDLISITNNESIAPFIPYENNTKTNFVDYYFISIEKYCNNRAIGNKEDDPSCFNMTGDSRFFMINEVLEKEEINVHNMRFKIPNYRDMQYDNIFCDSQRILVDGSEIYDSLFVLGCSDIGSHSTNITIEYMDGSIESKKLNFTTWINQSPLFNDSIAWKGNGAVHQDNIVRCYDFPVHLFAVSIPLQADKIIKNIRLGFCPNLHIFAITIAR